MVPVPDRKNPDDNEIILFVVLQQGIELNEEIRQQISDLVVAGVNPIHRPQGIYQLASMPRTKSAKIMFKQMRKAFMGLKNIGDISGGGDDVPRIMKDIRKFGEAFRSQEIREDYLDIPLQAA